MLLKTKRYPTARKGIAENAVCILFEADEIRYLSSHLHGAQPKLTWHGTIGQGLTLWFEGKGNALRETNDGRAMVAEIAAQFISAFQGPRPELRPTYEQFTKDDKPVLILAPIPSYDRDAAKVSAFNPAMTIPADPSLRNPLEKAESLFRKTDKPGLTTADVIAITARHTSKPTAAPPPLASNGNLKMDFPVPQTVSSDTQVSEILAGIELINSLLPSLGEDLILGLTDDRRRLSLVRRRVILEEVGAMA